MTNELLKVHASPQFYNVAPLPRRLLLNPTSTQYPGDRPDS